MDMQRQLASFASAFTQQRRALRLQLYADLPTDLLLPQWLEGGGGVSRCYAYRLRCLAYTAGLDLKTLLGLPVAVHLSGPGAMEKVICGVVRTVSAGESDGGFARYDLHIVPPLALLNLRSSNRVFQGLSVPAIVQQILGEHAQRNRLFAAHFAWRADLQKTYPARPYCVQYQETDLALIERLLAEEGISYRFTCTDDASANAVTTCVLFDDPWQLPTATAGPLRFHAEDGTASSITAWAGQHQLIAARTELCSFDYQSHQIDIATDSGHIDQGQSADAAQQSLGHYAVAGAEYAADADELNRYARLRQQAIDASARQFHGSGNALVLEAGLWFQLDDHPAHNADSPEQRQFVVTTTQLRACNNLPADLCLEDPAPGPGESAFQISFQAQRRGLALNPVFSPKPTAPGVQTARVVGPAGEEIHTDAQGRIKIQLHWQRPEEHPLTGAALDDNSSCWVRTALSSAGDGWGRQTIPRVGQEVLVQFLEGDIDRPVVTGVLYNGRHRAPAWSGYAGLPVHKVLSGYQSKEYKGHQFNELLFDDSTGQLRTKLSSAHGQSQLNLGFLVHPRQAGQGQPRGEGFELRTDQHGAIRASWGVLISAYAATGATGQQLERSEAMSLFDNSLALAHELGTAAAHQLASTPETGWRNQTIASNNAVGLEREEGHQNQLGAALKQWEQGSNTASAATPAPQAIVLVTAPQGIASLSAQSQTLSAGSNLDCVAQRDTNQTSGRRWLHNVGKHISFFVAGVADSVAFKLISAKGRILLQAQSDAIELAAATDIKLQAQQKIEQHAGDEILLAAGGSSIRISAAGIEIHTPKKIDARAALHTMNGPAALHTPLPDFPISAPGAFSQQLLITEPLTGQPQRVRLKWLDAAGAATAVLSQAGGHTERQITDAATHHAALIGPKRSWGVNYHADVQPFPLEENTHD